MENTILTYAFNAENRLVHINDVKNGLECGCICPGCREKLIAKNDGKIREHHFAHISGNDCGTGYQTIRHIWAKEILFCNRIIPIAINGKKVVQKVEDICMEFFWKELNITPDVLAIIKLEMDYRGLKIGTCNVPCIVEIFVTHKVDDQKAAIIKKAGIPAVEIDLSKSTATTRKELAKDMSNPEMWNIINDKVGYQYTAGLQNYLNNLFFAFRSNTGYSRSYSTPRRTYYRNYKKRR